MEKKLKRMLPLFSVLAILVWLGVKLSKPIAFTEKSGFVDIQKVKIFDGHYDLSNTKHRHGGEAKYLYLLYLGNQEVKISRNGQKILLEKKLGHLYKWRAKEMDYELEIGEDKYYILYVCN